MGGGVQGVQHHNARYLLLYSQRAEDTPAIITSSKYAEILVVVRFQGAGKRAHETWRRNK